MNTPKKLSTFLALVTAAAMLWHFKASADIASHYQPNRIIRATEALQQNKPDRTLAIMQGWVDKVSSPSLKSEGYSLICRAYFHKREFVKAEQACDIAVTAAGETRNWSDLNNRGVMRLMLGQFDAALEDFKQATALKPRSQAVHNNVAVAKRELRAAQQAKSNEAQAS